MNSALSKYLNVSIEKNNNANINESIILASIIASSCLTWAITPMFETTFMKNISAGIGGLLGGVGNLFGFGGKVLGLSGKSADDIKELLKKDPDDLTGNEKDLLKKAAKDKKLQKEFSNNDLKKLNKIIGSTQEETPEEPKEETPQETPEGITESLLALATAANKNEENPDKKAENESLINLISASTYDENGEPIPVEQREAKLKELVGEENWDSFKKDMEDRQKSVNTDELKESLEKAQKELKPEDAKKMLEDQKATAKAAHAKIKKEKEEQKNIDDEIQKLKDDPNADKNKIEELQNKKEELIKSSTIGKASSKTANAIIERAKKDEPKEPKKDEPKEPKKDEPKEPKKDEPKEPKKDEPKEPKKDEETDEEGNIVKDEEVTDPETGKKIKVKTYTGPRGGKFYYPDGKPKKPENKVYVENMSLKNYLLNSLIVEANTEESEEKTNKIDLSEENIKNIYARILDRFAYLTYLINDKENEDNKSKLQKIYDVLEDLMFKDGELRSIKEIVDYIKDLERDNNGKIPNLPSDGILKSLDTKMLKFKDYDKNTFDEYLAKVQKKFNLKKGSEKAKETSDSDEILNADIDKKSIDKDRKEEVIKDLTTALEEIEVSNKGICRAICIIDISSGLSVEKPKTPEDDNDVEGDVESEDNEDIDVNIEEASDDEKEMIANIQSLIETYSDEYDEYDEKQVDKWLDDAGINDAIEDEKSRNSFIKTFKEGLKSYYDDSDDDNINTDEMENTLDGESTNESINSIFSILEADENHTVTTGDKIKNAPKSAGAKAKKITKGVGGGLAAAAGAGLAFAATPKGAATITKHLGSFVAKTLASDAAKTSTIVHMPGDNLHLAKKGIEIVGKLASKGPILTNPYFLGGAAIVATVATVAAVRAAKKNRMKKMAAGLKSQIENEKDPKKKAELQEHYDKVMKSCFTADGKPRTKPKMKELSKEDRLKFKEQFTADIKNKELKEKGKLVVKEVDFKNDKIAADKAIKAKAEKDSENSKNTDKKEGKYIVKDEEVTDPETGKKIKVKTYTGPRGGKFYYPDGKPKNSENKVYVKENYSLLSNYLLEQINK